MSYGGKPVILHTTLSPENHRWLRKKCKEENMSIAYAINTLLASHRQQELTNKGMIDG